MLSLPPSVRIYVARDPVDMRKSFNGLSGIVRDVLQQDPLSGHLFVCFNRRRDQAKILWWDRSGFWLLCKRLEKGTFVLPDAGDGTTVSMRASELMLLLEGIDLRGARRQRRFDYLSAS
jgi:transposase